MRQLRPDLYGIRGWVGSLHLLVDGSDLVLMDAGFFGDFQRVQRAVAELGRRPGDLKVILLTHGHFDHTMNAAQLQRWSGATVYAPAGDELHVDGRHPYRGPSRVCGCLEALGRVITCYRPPRVDRWLCDGEELPLWGGLRVVALPGHTAGHAGYFSPSKRVFFVGDTFAFSWRVAMPPSIFNVNTPQVRESLCKAAQFDVDMFVPAHYFGLELTAVQRVRERAQRLASERKGRTSTPPPS